MFIIQNVAFNKDHVIKIVVDKCLKRYKVNASWWIKVVTTEEPKGQPWPLGPRPDHIHYFYYDTEEQAMEELKRIAK